MDARGERARHRRLAGARARPTRATSTSSGDRGHVEGTGSFDTHAVASATARRAAVVLPRPRRASSPHRIATAIGRGAAARAHRLAGADGAARSSRRSPRSLAEGTRRRRRRRRRHAGRQVFGQWAPERHVGLEGPAARARSLAARRFTGKRSTPYAPGSRPRLHAREGHRRRRRRLRRLVQPLALGRAERRERARDPRRRAGRPAGRVHRRRPRALPGPRRTVQRRLPRQRSSATTSSGSSVDREQVEVVGRDHALAPPAARATQSSRPAQYVAPDQDDGEVADLAASGSSTSASNSSSSVPKPPGKTTKPMRSARTSPCA